MCGLLGSFKKTNSLNLFEAAMSTLNHRGPDDCGFEKYELAEGQVILGHTRLSIIDLSSGGHQPMTSYDKRYTLVFNGEIYNYKELREELKAKGHIFNSESDTEVLLVAWYVWGEACINRLTGMFSFSIFDREKNTLTCVRDAFGIKPFFYAKDKKGFYFASEMSALLLLRGTGASLNFQRSYDYLVHADYDSSDKTFIDGVYHLEPGKIITFDMSTGFLQDPRYWWRPQVNPVSNMSFSDASSELQRLFLTSISQHLRSDVPLGAALSGGVDSSAVVCAIRHLEPDLPIHTFSFIAKDSPLSEESWVDVVNSRVNAISHKVIVDAKDLAKDLDEMIVAQGEPFGGTSIYAQYRVFKAAKEAGIKVTLDGQGADELLAGYNGYPGKRMHSLIDENRWGDAIHFINEWSKWPGRNLSHGIKLTIADLVSKNMYQFLRRFAGSDVRPTWLNLGQLKEHGVSFTIPRAFPEDVPGRRVVAELALSVSSRGLPALLRHADRNSMKFSIESRVPFLTTEIAEFLLKLPENFLISPEGETKHIFRSAMRGIVPDNILDRKDKIGFATPEQEWLNVLGDQVREWLLEDSGLEFLEKKVMIDIFDRMMAKKIPFSWQVWRWINFCRWHLTVFKGLSKAGSFEA